MMQERRCFPVQYILMQLNDLIRKLLVPERLSSNERKECLADLTTEKTNEHQKFMK
jgi:hypothetical protein